MKKTVSWNGLIAMAAILAMSVWVFGCTDTQTTTAPNAPAGPESLKGSIAGLVVDINNNPVAGAGVTLRFPGGTQTKKTGGDGGYLFSGVPVSGQLGCEEECDENPYLIVVSSPVIKVDGEKVTPYVTAYTAALLSFTSLQAIAAEEGIAWGSDWQAVGNLQVQAITAVMRRPNAVVSGYVIDTTTGLPASGALVSLNPSSIADPEWIWSYRESSFSIGNPTTTSNLDGLFTFTGVPEGSDADMVSYVVTVSAPDRQLCNYCDHPEVSVGTGSPHEAYWVDAGCGVPMSDDNGWNQSDPVALCPALPPSDSIDPYVIATNLPPNSVITNAQAGATFCWQFNEPMNLERGDGTIRQTGGGPIALNLDLTGWNLPSVDPGCPEGTIANPVFAMTPAEPLPEGRNFVFALNNMEDAAGNQYAGYTPARALDAFVPTDTGAPVVARNLRTGGDPDLMCVAGVSQDGAVPDPMQPFGGLAGNVPQANNLNLLFLCDDGDEIGDQNEEANWISLSWSPAVPCLAEEDGVVSAYNVYADNTGLGFVAGLPLLVGSTGAAWGAPPTSWEGYLQLQESMSYSYVQNNWPDESVNTAIQYYNQNNGGPDVPMVDPPNAFDDGFTIPMAVTAVNNDLREGPYSNEAQVRDVVPPTVADQGDGFDESVPTNWAILGIGAGEVGLYPVILDGPDIPGLGDPEIGDGNTYDSDRYAAWLATTRDLDIAMNEDLLVPQTPSATLSALGGGGETVVSASVTQAENGWWGTGNCDDLPTVTVVMNNLALVQQNDHIGISALDEAGNASNPGTVAGGLLSGDSVVHLYDDVVPLIQTGTVVAGTGTEEIMTLTFAEPLCVDDALADPPVECDVSADDIGAYYLNGSQLSAPVTAAVDETGTIVTLTAPLGFGVTDSIYLVVATVEDLQGNAQSYYGPDTLLFAVDDQIAPVLLSCYHSSAPDINILNPAVASDGELGVGDDFTTDGTDIFDITCDLSEELDTGVAVSFTGAATCTRTGVLTLTPTDVNFEITCTAGVIAAGNSITVLGFDLAGNQLTPAMTLSAVGLGTNIDPFTPPPT